MSDPGPASQDQQPQKTTGRWNNQEIMALLTYVEKNIVLTTSRGTSLKKAEFTAIAKAVKTKDANQCQYKWGQVSNGVISGCNRY